MKQLDTSKLKMSFDYNKEFIFDVQLSNLGGANRKYNEWIVEYAYPNTSGVRKSTLAAVMGLSEEQGNMIAEEAEFSIALHNQESFKIKDLPVDAECYVSEHCDTDLSLSYTVVANNDAVLQVEDKINDDDTKDLTLNTREKIDLSDSDIKIIFSGKPAWEPYILPAAGMNNYWYVLYGVAFIMLCLALSYAYSSYKRRKKN